MKKSPVINLDMEYYSGPAIIEFFRYVSPGWIAMQLLCEDQELGHWLPLVTATVNHIVAPMQEERDTTVLIKDYSENSGILRSLVEQGVLEPECLAVIPTGYVYLYKHRLTPKWITIAKRHLQEDRKG